MPGSYTDYDEFYGLGTAEHPEFAGHPDADENVWENFDCYCMRCFQRFVVVTHVENERVPLWDCPKCRKPECVTHKMGFDE